MYELYDDQVGWTSDLRNAFRTNVRVIGQAPTGFGKCLGKETPVLLFDGRIKLAKNIRVDDLLMGPDSQSRRVVSVTSGVEEMFRITPVKGDPYEVNRSHILSLRMTGGSDRSCKIPDGSIVNISIDEYLARNKTFRHCAKGWRTAVDFQPHNEPLKLDPWFMGFWLGDGNSKGPGITTGDLEAIEYITEYAKTIGLEVRIEPNSPGSVNVYMTTKESGPGRGHRSNPVTTALYQYRLLMDKHIPLRYLTASRADRLELLAGIMDSDGHLCKNGGFEIALKATRLFDDVMFLARSLGFSCSKKSKVINGKTYWRCNIYGPVDQVPCRIPRKQAPPRRQIKNVLLTGIAVESIGEGEYCGFEIEGPDRLFLLGDFTVTHNTVCFAYITSFAAAKGNRVIIIAHRREITDQISKALDEMSVRHGRIQPSHTMTDAPISVAMIQTLVRRFDQIKEPDFIIFDECHHCVAETYLSVVAQWPNVKILGVTATPICLSGKGLGRMFTALVEGPPPNELIAKGRLAQYTYLAPPSKVDLSGVKTRAGDYAVDELALAMDKAVITGDAIAHYQKYLSGRTAIAFCVRVDHAESVAAQFVAAGIPAASVDGTMDRSTRRDRLDGLATGLYKVLTSCALISEGLDVPSVGGVILLRPTKSLAMYLQQIGRGLRPKPDGSKCAIIDHVNNFSRHGLPDAPREWSLDDKKRKEPLTPTSRCEVCYRVFDAAPGWKRTMLEGINAGEARDCDEPEHPECVLRAVDTGSPMAPPKQVAGELIEITDAPAWGGGVSILRAKGDDWKTLLAAADDATKLHEIRRARGYHPNWVKKVLESRRRG